MLDIVAMIFGVVGTVILSLNRELKQKRRIVFSLYLISNIFFIIYGISIKSVGITVLNLMYLCLSIKGVIR